MESVNTLSLLHGLVAAACLLAAVAGLFATWNARQRPFDWPRAGAICVLLAIGGWIMLSAGQFEQRLLMALCAAMLISCAGLFAAHWIGHLGEAEEMAADHSVEKLREELLLREAAEQHLRSALADYRRSAADFEQFAYAASHDLQTPLRNIDGFARLLAQRYGDTLEGDARMYLQYMTQGVQQMQQLVDALLQLSRVGRSEARIEEKSLDEDLRVVREQLAGEIERLGAEIIAPDLPTVTADHALLVQLFQNLIGNALKFQPPGQKPRVTIRARRQNEDWHFTLTDNGIGIPAAEVDHVFAPFRRLHPHEEFAGTGMGLAICRKIVAHHEGEIWAEPHAGGAQIHLILPQRARLAPRTASG
ncbi:sensor histidine kinase [Solimonas soli]|uniref:sensor histidine kinase n=1 Tax=Solimonas soli TaxID=413479 RepID=UPI000688163E|nr:ATP-binding protein [Solimonas soli]